MLMWLFPKWQKAMELKAAPLKTVGNADCYRRNDLCERSAGYGEESD